MKELDLSLSCVVDIVESIREFKQLLVLQARKEDLEGFDEQDWREFIEREYMLLQKANSTLIHDLAIILKFWNILHNYNTERKRIGTHQRKRIGSYKAHIRNHSWNLIVKNLKRIAHLVKQNEENLHELPYYYEYEAENNIRHFYKSEAKNHFPHKNSADNHSFDKHNEMNESMDITKEFTHIWVNPDTYECTALVVRGNGFFCQRSIGPESMCQWYESRERNILGPLVKFSSQNSRGISRGFPGT